MKYQPHHITTLGAAKLALRFALALASPITTAIPVSATALQGTPFQIGQQEVGAVAGGLFGPTE